MYKVFQVGITVALTALGFTACGPASSALERSEGSAIGPITSPPVYDRYDAFFARTEGDRAYLYGSIGEGSLETLQSLLSDNPNLKTLVFVDMPGSSDDAIALDMAYAIRQAGLNTHMLATSDLESGAVMVFASGVKRTATCGASAGVHAWWDTAGYSAQDVPRDHPGHAHFLKYYSAMGIPERYYWFIMNAAPPENIYELSPAEMTDLRLLTHPMTC